MTERQDIQSALAQYGIPDAEYELIRHNENLTVKVDGKYLLRIHRHAEGFSTVPIYDGLDRDGIRRTELAFLRHLKECGMQVQAPIPNQAGELVTVLEDGTCATMLEWLPGHVLEKGAATKDICFQIGEMTARLHQAARSFQAEGILGYDAGLCGRLSEKLALETERGVLGKQYASVLQEACRFMRDRLGENRDVLAVHADLSPSNILITESGLVPIDFSLFGMGSPMMDIGSLYCSFGSLENRRAIAEGRRSHGGGIDFPMLDICYALNVLLYIVLHNLRPQMDSCAEKNMNRWCEEIFLPLADGKQLIREDFFMPNIKR